MQTVGLNLESVTGINYKIRQDHSSPLAHPAINYSFFSEFQQKQNPICLRTENLDKIKKYNCKKY